MADRRKVASLVAGLGGAVALLPSGYLAVLTAGALGERRRPADAGPAAERLQRHLTVLVPAHDEELLLGRCLETLLAQSYPRDRYDVVVIADNCIDGTARVARDLGCEVLERTDLRARGKGHALRWAMDLLAAAGGARFAFVVVDADSVTDPEMLAQLELMAPDGVAAVQAEYLALTAGPGPKAELRAAAFLLFHRVRFRGKAVLGLPCSLVGNGMLLTAELVRVHPWDAYTGAEDLEYSTSLRLAGVRPRYAAGALLHAPVSSDGVGADVQRLRWEGGRASVVAAHLPALVRALVVDRRVEVWDAVADLAVPPLGVLAAATVAGATTSTLLAVTGRLWPAAAAPWLASAGLLAGHVLLGLRAAGAPPETFRALAAAPALVAREMTTRARLLRGTGATTWVRTPRSQWPAP